MSRQPSIRRLVCLFAALAAVASCGVVLLPGCVTNEPLQGDLTDGSGITDTNSWMGILAFVGKTGAAGDQTDIFTIELPGGTPRNMSDDELLNMQPALSADAAKLASVSTPGPPGQGNAGSSGDIFVRDLPGGTPRNATNTPDVAETNPKWIPGTNRIVFEREGTIWVMDSDGSNQQKLLGDPTYRYDYYMPSVSPDGALIGCIRGDSTGAGSTLVTVKPDGTEETPLDLAGKPGSVPLLTAPKFVPSKTGGYHLYTKDLLANDLISLEPVPGSAQAHRLHMEALLAVPDTWASEGYALFVAQENSKDEVRLWGLSPSTTEEVFEPIRFSELTGDRLIVQLVAARLERAGGGRVPVAALLRDPVTFAVGLWMWELDCDSEGARYVEESLVSVAEADMITEGLLSFVRR